MTVKNFNDLMAHYDTLGDLLAAMNARIEALEPIREFISVIRDEYAGRVAGDDSATKILAMTEEEREKIAKEILNDQYGKLADQGDHAGNGERFGQNGEPENGGNTGSNGS